MLNMENIPEISRSDVSEEPKSARIPQKSMLDLTEELNFETIPSAVSLFKEILVSAASVCNNFPDALRIHEGDEDDASSEDNILDEDDNDDENDDDEEEVVEDLTGNETGVDVKSLTPIASVSSGGNISAKSSSRVDLELVENTNEPRKVIKTSESKPERSTSLTIEMGDDRYLRPSVSRERQRKIAKLTDSVDEEHVSTEDVVDVDRMDCTETVEGSTAELEVLGYVSPCVSAQSVVPSTSCSTSYSGDSIEFGIWGCETVSELKVKAETLSPVVSEPVIVDEALYQKIKQDLDGYLKERLGLKPQLGEEEVAFRKRAGRMRMKAFVEEFDSVRNWPELGNEGSRYYHIEQKMSTKPKRPTCLASHITFQSIKDKLTIDTKAKKKALRISRSAATSKCKSLYSQTAMTEGLSISAVNLEVETSSRALVGLEATGTRAGVFLTKSLQEQMGEDIPLKDGSASDLDIEQRVTKEALLQKAVSLPRIVLPKQHSSTHTKDKTIRISQALKDKLEASKFSEIRQIREHLHFGVLKPVINLEEAENGNKIIELERIEEPMQSTTTLSQYTHKMLGRGQCDDIHLKQKPGTRCHGRHDALFPAKIIEEPSAKVDSLIPLQVSREQAVKHKQVTKCKAGRVDHLAKDNLETFKTRVASKWREKFREGARIRQLQGVVLPKTSSEIEAIRYPEILRQKHIKRALKALQRLRKIVRVLRTWRMYLREAGKEWKAFLPPKHIARFPYHAYIPHLNKPKESSQSMKSVHFEEISFSVEDYKFNRKCACPKNLLKVLEKPPRERTRENIDLVKRAMQNFQGFSVCEDLLKDELCRYFRFEKYNRGRVIVRKGQRGTRLYFVYSGTVAIYPHRTISHATLNMIHQLEMTSLTKGDRFGEMALMTSNCRRFATVVCAEETELFSVDLYELETDRLLKLLSADYNRKYCYFRKLDLFSSWSDEKLHTLVKQVYSCDVGRNNTLVVDSQKDGWITFVMKGCVDVIRELNLTESPPPTRIVASEDIGKFAVLVKSSNVASVTSVIVPTDIQEQCNQEKSVLQSLRILTFREGEETQSESSTDSSVVSEKQNFRPFFKPGLRTRRGVCINVIVDALSPGEVFGLHNIFPDQAKQPSVALVSRFARVNLMAKSALLSLMDFDTEMKIRSGSYWRDIPPNEELYVKLAQECQWKRFRRQTVEDLIHKKRLEKAVRTRTLLRRVDIPLSVTRPGTGLRRHQCQSPKKSYDVFDKEPVEVRRTGYTKWDKHASIGIVLAAVQSPRERRQLTKSIIRKSVYKWARIKSGEGVNKIPSTHWGAAVT